MEYTVKKLAKMAGISVRTLHYYDEIGLLEPSSTLRNGYRQYREKELLRLQQILFFRELEFKLEDIKKILDAPDFNIIQALEDHHKLIEIKKKRLAKLLRTVQITIKKMQNNKPLQDDELYSSFNKEEMEEYKKEAKQRWGHTEAYKQSMERTKNWTREDYARIKRDADIFMKEIVAQMDKGIDSPDVQALIEKWREGINQFYDTDLETCRNLATLYISDPRFTAYYEKYTSGLAQFMYDAIIWYCNRKEE